MNEKRRARRGCRRCRQPPPPLPPAAAALHAARCGPCKCGRSASSAFLRLSPRAEARLDSSMARSEDRAVRRGCAKSALPLTVELPRELFTFLTIFAFLSLQSIAKSLYGWYVVDSENRKRNCLQAEARRRTGGSGGGLADADRGGAARVAGGLLVRFVRGRAWVGLAWPCCNATTYRGMPP